jgi:hypothetical protein
MYVNYNPFYRNLYHRITKNLTYSHHFLLRLKERFNMNYYDLFKIVNSFVFHNGTKFCRDSLTVNAKVSSGRYPTADYLYSRKYDMILVFDRRERVLITVEKFNTDYYFKKP